MIIRNAKVYQEDGTFRTGNIYTEDDRIISEERLGDDVLEASGYYAVPGLTDIHFHGCDGYDFCDGTLEAIEAMARYEAKNGITTICPASMTLGEERLSQIYKAYRNYQSKTGAILCGINMEGPFLSKEKKGAQNADFLHEPDIKMFRRLQEISGGLIKLVALAPDGEGAMKFIEALQDQVVISIAHTASDYEHACAAIKKGARHVTHLYNAMPAFSHRNPGVVGAAFDAPECEVELICDGVHIHPSVVRATFSMFSENRIIMISDSMEATGMPDGKYSLGGQEVNVAGNLATLSDGTLAGSATNLMDCVRICVKEMGIPLESAIKCAAVNPAKAIGIYDEYGSITPGKIANIVLLNEDLDIISVILKGRLFV